MKLRRHLADLTVDDLAQHPLCVSVMDTYDDEDDEQDEDTRWAMTPYPKPYDPRQPLRMDFVCLVAAELTLADGDIFPGCLKAKGRGMIGVEDTQPVILTAQGQVDLYFGSRQPGDVETQIIQNYRILGKSAEQVFPLRYRSKVLLTGLAGGPYEGIAEGFSCMAASGVETVR